VGVVLKEHAVLEGAGLSLIGVDDDVLGVAGRAADEAPLAGRREAGTATPLQPGGVEDAQDLVGVVTEFLELRVGAPPASGVELRLIGVAGVAQKERSGGGRGDAGVGLARREGRNEAVADLRRDRAVAPPGTGQPAGGGAPAVTQASAIASAPKSVPASVQAGPSQMWVGGAPGLVRKK
jgi:hypothetical protein